MKFVHHVMNCGAFIVQQYKYDWSSRSDLNLLFSPILQKRKEAKATAVFMGAVQCHPFSFSSSLSPRLSL